MAYFNSAWSYDQNNRLHFLKPKTAHPCTTFGIVCVGAVGEVYLRGKFVVDSATVPALLVCPTDPLSANFVLNPANFVLLAAHNGYKPIPEEEIKTLKIKYSKDACTWFKSLFMSVSKNYQILPDTVRLPGAAIVHSAGSLEPRQLLSNFEGAIPAVPTWSIENVFGDNADFDEEEDEGSSSNVDIGGKTSTPTTPSAPTTPQPPPGGLQTKAFCWGYYVEHTSKYCFHASKKQAPAGKEIGQT